MSVFLGYSILKKLLPQLFHLSKLKSISFKPVKIAQWMVVFPASYLVGTLVMTWVTYFLCYFLRSTGKPMLWGNVASLSLFTVLSLVIVVVNKKDFAEFFSKASKIKASTIDNFYMENRIELFFVFFALLVSVFMMFSTFNIFNGMMNISPAVHGDFGPHLSVIRSFSLGDNFPTGYPHFAGDNIRYHFLFQFLTGNLEYLGIRIDWAFNIPSILSLVSFYMLLFSVATIIVGKAWVGVLSSIFFLFRSSLGFFHFVADMKTTSIGQITNKIIDNRTYIGKTTNDAWGLWTQNVYINQRHFAFSLSIMLLIIIAVYPLFLKMIHALKKHRQTAYDQYKKQAQPAAVTSAPDQKDSSVQNANLTQPTQSYGAFYVKKWFSEFVFSADAWLPKNLIRCLFIGLLLGAISFWNGAVVLATLPILCVLAIFSKHRLEYLIIATITVLLSFAESSLFMGSSGSAVSVNIQNPIKFLAEFNEANSVSFNFGDTLYKIDFIGLANYYFNILGIIPFLLLIGAFFMPKGMRWIMLAFVSPLVMATILTFTPDINANHKFVNISIILLNILAAYVVYRLFTVKMVLMKGVAVILTLVMTITGISDVFTFINYTKTPVQIKVDDPLFNWTKEKTNPNDIFLTDVHVIHPILLAGRKIYYGWPYYAWSAGYKTDVRERVIKQILGGTDREEVRRLAIENNINYIVIEDGFRNAKVYTLNEDLLKSIFEQVYNEPKSKVTIYKVK
ncbi:MAG: hypothetical protein N2645_11090 [Clostridia bacterium]|nr:hypothetical protein [Clostridia bacterium]